jgi:predicted dehydrogenase
MTQLAAPARPIRIGMVGTGFMAQLHSAAYKMLPLVNRNTVPQLELVRIAGRTRVREAARDFGWAEATNDWRAVTEADDIDLVDIVTPNDTHAEIVASAAAYRKTIVCEKPLARHVGEARQMREAVARAGVPATVCFVYRTWPAVQVARQIIERGDIGTIHGFRGWFLHDHVSDQRDVHGWRLDPRRAGPGVIADIGSHMFDLAHHLVGDVSELFATTRGILPAKMPVHDEADIQLRFQDGATGHIWVSWLATGTGMDVGFEIHGNRGAVRFTWTRPSELSIYDARRPSDARGFTTVPLGPVHPSAAPLTPITGIGLGYQQSFVTLLGMFLQDVRNGSSNAPTFDEGVTAARYVDAALTSDRQRAWITL